MRGADDVGMVEQNVFSRGFGFEHIERGPGDVTGIKRGFQVFLDNQSAARS